MQRIGRIGAIPTDVMDIRMRAPAAAALPPWWLVAGKTCVAAYQPKGVASLPESYINVANPGTHDLTLGHAPGWNSTNGWIASGDAWLKTGIIPHSGMSVLVRYSNFTPLTSGSSLIGAGDEPRRLMIIPYFINNGAIYANGDQVYNLPVLDSGVVGVAGQKAYQNGINVGGTIPTWSGNATEELYILTKNGSYNIKITAYVQIVAIWDAVLTAGEVATVSAAMAAL